MNAGMADQWQSLVGMNLISSAASLFSLVPGGRGAVCSADEG